MLINVSLVDNSLQFLIIFTVKTIFVLINFSHNMSDNEISDDMDELHELLREYAEKEKATSTETTKQNDNTSKEPLSSKPTKWIKTEEEIRSEKLLFGDKEGLLENLIKSSKSHKSIDNETTKAKKRKAAWQDSDDDEIKPESAAFRIKKTYKDFLQSRFNRITAAPKWADLDRDDERDSDEEILRTVGFIDKSKSQSLAPTRLGFKKLKDLNRATYLEESVSDIQFHPTSTAAMVSGLSGVATIYSIDGYKNEKLHSIRFPRFPITCSRILPCGTQAMFTSRKRHYYSYDLMKATEMLHGLPRNMKRMSNFEISPCGKYFAADGKFGELHLFDFKSKEIIHTFKQEANCRAIKFSLDSSKIIASSNQSSVSIFDIRQQRMMHSFLDDGCIVGHSLDLSPDGKMLATGSSEGAVNIYSFEKVLASKEPQPEKTILNLTTCINDIKFNHTSEMLAICSHMVPAGVKIVHFPTGTVFSNFPGFNTDLNAIRSVAFSPSSGYLALGSSQKQAYLYRLKHFTNY